MTLHYTRRMYNGLFILNKALGPRTASFNPDDSVKKLVPVPFVLADPARPPKKDDDHAEKKAIGTIDQVTPLAGRLFGTYTLVISVVRLYVAYNISSPPMYQLGIMTYVVAWAHFVSEMVLFRTMYLGGPQSLPLFFATLGIVWMSAQYGYYVKA